LMLLMSFMAGEVYMKKAARTFASPEPPFTSGFLFCLFRPLPLTLLLIGRWHFNLKPF
jgi:hypothetical protein